jgi:hypothetical protein
MKKAIIVALLGWASIAAGNGIELTIEPVTNAILVTEASARGLPPPQDVALTGGFPHPDTGEPTTVTANNIVDLPVNASPEAQAWARTNACRVDFFACIKNTSTNTLNFYDEWNSWGFGRLKIVCYGWREIWITKQPGVWYRNFPSWTSLRPGAVMRIPVAFDETLWGGVTKAEQAKDITGVRVFYDQLGTPTNAFGISAEHWQGCEFSPYYDVGSVLPRRGFKTSKQKKMESRSNQQIQAIGASAPQPDL